MTSTRRILEVGPVDREHLGTSMRERVRASFAPEQIGGLPPKLPSGSLALEGALGGCAGGLFLGSVLGVAWSASVEPGDALALLGVAFLAVLAGALAGSAVGGLLGFAVSDEPRAPCPPALPPGFNLREACSSFVPAGPAFHTEVRLRSPAGTPDRRED